jgi:hypothetical protein
VIRRHNVKYCNRCNVVIENNLDKCPLCHQKLLKSNDGEVKDFPIQKIVKNDLNRKIIRLLIFIFILMIGINIVLNIAFSYKFIWAPYSIVILFYIYLMIRESLLTYKNIGSIVTINVYMLSVIGFILDMILGFRGWSIDYLMPILIIAGTLSLIVFLFIKPKMFTNYFIYVLTITFFGIIELVFLLSGIIKFKIISIIAIFISVMSIIGLFMFGNEDAKNEFIKRFHF